METVILLVVMASCLIGVFIILYDDDQEIARKRRIKYIERRIEQSLRDKERDDDVTS